MLDVGEIRSQAGFSMAVRLLGLWLVFTSFFSACTSDSPPGSSPCLGVGCDGHGSCQVEDNQPVCRCEPGYVNHWPTRCAQEFSPGLCTRQGWCWRNPVPLDTYLRAVWGSAPDDVWAVGERNVLHWNGYEWSLATQSAGATLTAIWGSADDDVWAAGYSEGNPGELLHFDGNAWSVIDSPGRSWFCSIFGSGADDVWFASEASLLHWDGSAWTVNNDELWYGCRALWGTAPEDLWAGGSGDAPIIHWDGNRWEESLSWTNSQADLSIASMWGTGPNDVWAAGSAINSSAGLYWGEVYHWDGSEWTHVLNSPGVDFSTVAGAGPKDVWVGGMRCNGGGCGPGSVVMHWDGSAWSDQSDPTILPYSGMWFFDSGNAFAVGYIGTIASWDGSRWNAVTKMIPCELQDIWAAAAEDIWFFGNGFSDVFEDTGGTILHWDGRTLLRVQDVPEGSLLAVWVSPGGDAWAAGSNGIVMRFDGVHSWLPVPLGTTNDLNGIWGFSPADIWTVGSGGIIQRWNGLAWSGEESGITATLNGIWGTAGDDLWAVGDGATILHWDGNSWKSFPGAPADVDLHAVFGTYRDDVWAGGETRWQEDAGVIIHWDGSTWTEVYREAGVSVQRIWGLAGDDLWAAAGQDAILHWDGHFWTRADTGTRGWISAVGVLGREIWAAGWDILVRERF